MGLIDAAVLLIILISGIFALYRGLVRELLGLTAWVLAAFGALYGLTYVRPLFRKLISNTTIADIVAAAVIALVILVICTLINAHVTTKLRQSALSGLDRLLGFFFGLLRGALFIVIIYFGASLLVSQKQMDEYQESSFTLPYVQKATEWVQKILPAALAEKLEQVDMPAEDKGIRALIKAEEEKQGIETTEKTEEEKKDEPAYDDTEREDLNALILQQIAE